MKKLLFFIFILNCIGNKGAFKENYNGHETIQSNENKNLKSIEEFLSIESEKAIDEDNPLKLKKLFSKGLRINKKYNGETLLFRAAKENKKECIKYLLSQGAIISEEFNKNNLQNQEVEWDFPTPSWQRSISLDELVDTQLTFKMLRDRQKTLAEDIFIKLSSKHHRDEEQYILNRIRAGANINKKVEEIEGYKCSSLHALAPRGTRIILEEFMNRYEGDINEIDGEGRTALSLAMEGNIVFAKALVEIGADPNIHNSCNLNYAPVVYAIHNWPTHGDVEFLEILMHKTTRDDILKECLNVLKTDKFKKHLKTAIDLTLNNILKIENQLKNIKAKEETLKLEKQLKESNIKIYKMKSLKLSLKRNYSNNLNPKNILLTEAIF